MSGSSAAKRLATATFSRSPATSPATGLPKRLWPLLAVMSPRTSSRTRCGTEPEKLPATIELLIDSAPVDSTPPPTVTPEPRFGLSA